MQQRRTLLTALFSALIIIGGFIRFPLPPIPITLQTLFVLLAGLLAGTRVAFFSVLTYLFLGAVGLPIFTGGGGLAYFVGPTGGYLIGLLPAALISGLAGNWQLKNSERPFSVLRAALAIILATASTYLCGVTLLVLTRSLSWSAAAKAGVLPFLLGDTLKGIVAVQMARTFGQRVRKMLSTPLLLAE